MKVLLVDHQDSFVYNLFQQLSALGADVTCLRHDRAWGEFARLDPDAIVLSPGPGHPRDPSVTEVSRRLLRETGPETPVLGVCLGHQLLADVLGGRVVRAPRPVHGETAEVHHRGVGLFDGIASPLVAARYHSLVVDGDRCPSRMEITARTRGGVVMALRARDRPWSGLQFHPESYLTPQGDSLIANFLRKARR